VRQSQACVSASAGTPEIFAGIRPAATAVIVAGLLDPAWLVEIEAEAQLP
jgi:enamine deaminase RidA (YjgF/YER057c/UK114 family)